MTPTERIIMTSVPPHAERKAVIDAWVRRRTPFFPASYRASFLAGLIDGWREDVEDASLAKTLWIFSAQELLSDYNARAMRRKK
jgi:hypothetical protein